MQKQRTIFGFIRLLIGDLKVQVGGGGFSPGKLRSMLLGVEKKRKEKEDSESAFTLRSQPPDFDDLAG